MTRAAERLHVSQSTMSKQLKELENELGSKLFVRTNYSIKLTEAGMLLKKRAEDILVLVEKTEAEFRSIEEIDSGDIFVGAPESESMMLFANDSETKKQIFETKEYVDTLKKACRNYHIAFSLDVEEGGYFHDDGEYTEETSLVLALIDADSKIVKKLAKRMCELFHQESVLVTESDIIGRFIRPDESE